MANSTLSEWLAQTKKISKSIDYHCMDTIDSIIEGLHWVDKKTIIDNKDFFDSLCKKYHKPNPVDLIKKRKRAKTPCQAISLFTQKSIERCLKLQLMVEFQWFEIIDFFFERPQLVNPNSIDEYTASKINEVCRKNKKNNPLKSDISKKFGKFFKDKDGEWRKERRQRF